MERRPFKQQGGSLESLKLLSPGPERLSWTRSSRARSSCRSPGNVTPLAQSPCRAPSSFGQLAADAPLGFLAAAAPPVPRSAAPSPLPPPTVPPPSPATRQVLRRRRRRSGEQCKAEPGKWPSYGRGARRGRWGAFAPGFHDPPRERGLELGH